MAGLAIGAPLTLSPHRRRRRRGRSGHCGGQRRSGHEQRGRVLRPLACARSSRGCYSSGSAWSSACGASAASGTTCGTYWPGQGR